MVSRVLGSQAGPVPWDFLPILEQKQTHTKLVAMNKTKPSMGRRKKKEVFSLNFFKFTQMILKD